MLGRRGPKRSQGSAMWDLVAGKVSAPGDSPAPTDPTNCSRLRGSYGRGLANDVGGDRAGARAPRRSLGGPGVPTAWVASDEEVVGRVAELAAAAGGRQSCRAGGGHRCD